MIEPRIYRAAFLPALLTLVLVAFSFEDRPPAAPQGLAADVLFEGRLAVRELRAIVAEQPDRRAGTVGNQAIAMRVQREFAARGFETQVDRFEDQDEELLNVVGRRVGKSRGQIVVIAGRDARSVPDATGSAADTAVLIELARVFEGRVSDKSLLLASVDGASLGDAGARRLAERLGDDVEAVLIVSDAAARRADGTLTVAWSNDASRISIGLARTATGSLRQEVGSVPPDAGAFGQFARLSFPIGIGAQGPLLERGFDALRLSGSGELPPPRAETRAEDVNVERLGDMGRTLLRTVSAVDAAPALEHGPPSYLLLRGRVMPGWAISVLALALLLPALVASIDAFARARRRRERVAAWWPWVLAGVAPFAAALALSELLVLGGQVPNAPPAAEPPSAHPLDSSAAVVMAAAAGIAALSWLAVRWWLFAGRRRPGAGAGTAAALLLSATGLAVWLLNPYAALLLVPAVHLWLLVLLSGDSLPRRLAGAMALGGLVLPAFVGLYYLLRFSLDPLEGAWYLFLLVTGHQVGLPTAALGCVLLGLFSVMLQIAVARPRRPRPEPGEDAGSPRIRGPQGYAGPGSLGGTESALGR